jgi:hypothetical protein
MAKYEVFLIQGEGHTLPEVRAQIKSKLSLEHIVSGRSGKNKLPCCEFDSKCGAQTFSQYSKRSHVIYRVLECRCGDSCTVKLKVITCSIQNRFKIYSNGHEHSPTEDAPVPRTKLDPGLVKFVTDRLEVRSRQVRREMEAEDIPVATKSSIRYIKRAHRANENLTNRLADVKDQIKQLTIPVNNEAPLWFGFKWSDKNEPILGDGDDDNLVQIGLTSRVLLEHFVEASKLTGGRLMLHLDETFQLDNNEYVLMVAGT